VSQAAVNFASDEDSKKFWPIGPSWPLKWTYLGLVTLIFSLWTWPDSVHRCHMSHPVNLRLKWYSIALLVICIVLKKTLCLINNYSSKLSSLQKSRDPQTSYFWLRCVNFIAQIFFQRIPSLWQYLSPKKQVFVIFHRFMLILNNLVSSLHGRCTCSI